MRFRVPNKGEVKSILTWGSAYAALHIPYTVLYVVRQSARLIVFVAGNLENIYHQSFIQPMRNLVWVGESPLLEVGNQPKLIEEAIELFDWHRFRSEPDTFPHIRIIAKSGMGKTTLARYLMHLLGGKQAVVTPKTKPGDWQGIQVYGKGFNYAECEAVLCELKNLMYANYQVIDQGLTPEMVNVALDEWRLIKENVAIAGDLVKEFITVARDAKIRLLALAQGEQVSTWGLQGESDLGECFTDVRLGEFALDHAKKLKLSSSVQDWLSKQKRPCMIDRYPAEIPNLQGFQFGTAVSPIKPRSSEVENAETLSPTVLQPATTSENEVPSNAEILLYRAFRAFQGSESDFIKQVWGARDYKLGKAELEALKRKFS